MSLTSVCWKSLSFAWSIHALTFFLYRAEVVTRVAGTTHARQIEKSFSKSTTARNWKCSPSISRIALSWRELFQGVRRRPLISYRRPRRSFASNPLVDGGSRSSFRARQTSSSAKSEIGLLLLRSISLRLSSSRIFPNDSKRAEARFFFKGSMIPVLRTSATCREIHNIPFSFPHYYPKKAAKF